MDMLKDKYFVGIAIVMLLLMSIGFFLQGFNHWPVPLFAAFLIGVLSSDEELEELEEDDAWKEWHGPDDWEDYKSMWEHEEALEQCVQCGYVVCVCKPMVTEGDKELPF